MYYDRFCFCTADAACDRPAQTCDPLMCSMSSSMSEEATNCELSEQDSEDVQEHAKQAQGEEHRTSRCHDPLASIRKHTNQAPLTKLLLGQPPTLDEGVTPKSHDKKT
jgi:hypothetical protein